MEQTIRFVTTSDGVKLAFATSGGGPALLKRVPMPIPGGKALPDSQVRQRILRIL